MKIKVTGIKETLKYIEQSVEKQISESKPAIVDALVVKLKEATPVDTGHARDSWKRNGDSIENDTDYIDDLNRGTSQQAPAYFIERTLLSQPGIKPNGIIVNDK